MQHELQDNQNSLISKASFLRLAASELTEGIRNGNFSSLYKGQGIEFSNVRDYIRGDDIRSIDWNVTARMGRPFVKVFNEERELQLLLIVDSSLSMQNHTDSKRTKYQSCAEAAALLAIACEINDCPVGAVLFDGEVHFSCKPKSGREQTMLLLTHLDKLPEKNVKGSVLKTALAGAGNLLKKRSLIFVLSDFRTSGWEKPLITLAQKNDVVAVRVVDSFEDELPSMGTVTFSDMESDLKMKLPTSSGKFKAKWREFNSRSENHWKEICSKHGILDVTMHTNDEPVQVLSEVFNQKNRKL